MSPEQEPAVEISAILGSARIDKEGAWKLTLEISAANSAQVAALTQYTEQVFRVKFYPDQQQPSGRRRL